MKKLQYLWTLLGLACLPSASFGAVANNSAAIKTEVDTITTNAEAVFDAIVPVVIAVVALGILIKFAKLIKRG